MGSVRLAVTDADMASARALSMEWLDWHWRTYPDIWPEGEDHPMEPARYKAIVEDLPSIHARPLGGILIGSVEGRDCGCVMYNQEEEGVAVFNRMFVGENGRGHGLGRKMLGSDGRGHVFLFWLWVGVGSDILVNGTM